MRFNKKEFLSWFRPENNLINPVIPPKNAFDAVHILFFFLVFGIPIVSIALLSSLEFGTDSRTPEE